MIVDIINEFRRINNKPPVLTWEKPLNDYCLLHCLEMAKRGYHYHSEEYYRPGYGEIVAKASFIDTTPTTIRNIIFEVFGKSIEGHREALLNWNTMAYGFYINKGSVYMVIRGK